MSDRKFSRALRLASMALAVCLVQTVDGAGKYLPAFPGAEGFGSFTPGGRGGKVLFVTTLEDYDPSKGEAPIPGSLRQVIATKGPRQILFKTSGTIFLKSVLVVREPFLTIAGQTVPGDGICIARYTTRVEAHDVIIRHVRFRLGDEARAELGTLDVSSTHDVILDHCSISWSMDENCTLHGPGVRNVTVQWCLIYEGLNRSFHPKGEHGHGSLLRTDGGALSIHHSVYAHNNARNPRPGGYEDTPGVLLDFRNNVVYDWGATSGYSGLERTRLNYVGNYFKPGPSTSVAVREFGFSVQTFRTKMFLADNFFFDKPQTTAENWRLVRKWGKWDGEIKNTNIVPEPFPALPSGHDHAVQHWRAHHDRSGELRRQIRLSRRATWNLPARTDPRAHLQTQRVGPLRYARQRVSVVLGLVRQVSRRPGDRSGRPGRRCGPGYSRRQIRQRPALRSFRRAVFLHTAQRVGGLRLSRCDGSGFRKIKIKIGTTSFGFRYAFLDPANTPTFVEMIRQAREAGVERLQICENTRPLEVSKAEWREALKCAADLGVEIQLGCKALKPEIVERYIALAQELACNQLRIVMEDPDHHEHATRENATRLLADIVPKLQRAGLRLAIENHFDSSSTLLVELASPYPAEVVGFCVDTANSLRSFEPSLEVLRLLRERAYCYHLKDYRVVGSMISFAVVGAPLGEGDLDLDGCLRMIFERKPVPHLFVETWTPSENNRDRDVALDAQWVRLSVKNLRGRLPHET